MRIALLYTRLRAEERLLIEAFEQLGVEIEPIDLRTVVFDPETLGGWGSFDAVIDRSVSLTAGRTAVRVLEGLGVRCVNPGAAVDLCADKLATTLALANAGIAQPRSRVAVNAEAGLAAIEELGYPCVIKPTVGSWGRLVARVNDRDAAEAILEHRETLGSATSKVYYVQEHIDKPGRDLRVFVVGGRAVAAIARSSEHWVTNTARGATAEGIELTEELIGIAEEVSAAMGGRGGADLCAVDLLECPVRGLLVNEVNHSMEFRNSIETTGVNIPLLVAEHVMHVASQACEGAIA